MFLGCPPQRKAGPEVPGVGNRYTLQHRTTKMWLPTAKPATRADQISSHSSTPKAVSSYRASSILSQVTPWSGVGQRLARFDTSLLAQLESLHQTFLPIVMDGVQIMCRSHHFLQEGWSYTSRQNEAKQELGSIYINLLWAASQLDVQ